MKRRDFSSGLIAAGLGGATVTSGGLILPGRANATITNEEQDGARMLDPFGRVQLSLGTQVIVLTWFIIALQSGFLGLDLRSPSPQFTENRVNTGNVPLIGGLFRPTLATRFADAALIGFLVLVGTMLILMPRAERRLRNQKVVIAHREMSWEPARRTTPVRLSEIPSLGELARMRSLGPAYQKRNELLVLIRPTLADNEFDD